MWSVTSGCIMHHGPRGKGPIGRAGGYEGSTDAVNMHKPCCLVGGASGSLGGPLHLLLSAVNMLQGAVCCHHYMLSKVMPRCCL